MLYIIKFSRLVLAVCLVDLLLLLWSYSYIVVLLYRGIFLTKVKEARRTVAHQIFSINAKHQMSTQYMFRRLAEYEIYFRERPSSLSFWIHVSLFIYFYRLACLRACLHDSLKTYSRLVGLLTGLLSRLEILSLNSLEYHLNNMNDSCTLTTQNH